MKRASTRGQRRSPSSATKPDSLRILSFDIGGTGLKAAVIDGNGTFIVPRRRVPTPDPCPPKVMMAALEKLAARLPHWNRISAGFPGYVKRGHVVTAPHFGTKVWDGFPLESELATTFGAPARLMNDADVQGLAVIDGKGLEFVMTLGTGFGSALFRDGDVMPHLEIAHIPVRHGLTYNEYVGDAARKKTGNKHWNRRVARVIKIMEILLNYDRLYIGGGNARHVKLKLPKHASRVSNDAGIEGGAALWHPLSGNSLAARRAGAV